VSISPRSLYFGAQQVDSTGPAQDYTVWNFGNAALTISGVAISGPHPGDFLAANDCTSGPINPGVACRVAIRFSPTFTGLRRAQVAVVDNAASGSQGAAVRGYGAGPNSFIPTGSMQAARDESTATLLQNGEVLIAGGEQGVVAPTDPGRAVGGGE